MDVSKIIFPRACRLFKDIDEKGFRNLCECLHAKELHLLNKEAFLFEDDPSDRIGVVVMGNVRLTRRRLDGGRNVLENVGQGDIFGMTYAFRGADTMGIGASSVGESVVLLLDTRNITRPCEKLCDAHMQFVRNLLAVMSQKTFQIKQKLRILSQRTIRSKVMLFLQILAKRNKSMEFDIPFDRQAMADYLCVDRSALSAELSKLRDEGVLTFEKNHFRLLKSAQG